MFVRALIGGVLPLMTSPAGLIILSVGAIALMLTDNKEKQDAFETVPDGSEPLDEPLNGEFLTVSEIVDQPWPTVDATAETTVHSTVEEPYKPSFFAKAAHKNLYHAFFCGLIFLVYLCIATSGFKQLIKHIFLITKMSAYRSKANVI